MTRRVPVEQQHAEQRDARRGDHHSPIRSLRRSMPQEPIPGQLTAPPPSRTLVSKHTRTPGRGTPMSDQNLRGDPPVLRCLELRRLRFARRCRGHGLRRPRRLQPPRQRGLEAPRRPWPCYRAGFSDLMMTIDDEVAAGDVVVVRWHATRRCATATSWVCRRPVNRGRDTQRHHLDAVRGRQGRRLDPVGRPGLHAGHRPGAAGDGVAAVLDRRPALGAACALSVFASSIARVIGPTPPGTGVIAPATSLTASKSTSPASCPRRCGWCPRRSPRRPRRPCRR